MLVKGSNLASLGPRQAARTIEQLEPRLPKRVLRQPQREGEAVAV